MSRSKPNKVFAIVDDLGRVQGHVIARHGKGALMVARNHGVDGGSYTAREVDESYRSRALNLAEEK